MTDRPSLLPGILLTVLAGVIFASMDAVGKYLTGVLPVLQVVWGRYLFQTVFTTAYLIPRSGFAFLRSRRPILQAVRGLALLFATLSMYRALAHVPLADATAVMFVSPILVTLLSVVFLGERIGPHRILAILAGLAGMLLILRPGFGTFHPALLLALLGAFANTIYLLLTRQLAGAEDAAATQFNTTALGALVMSGVMLLEWQTPSPAVFAFMALGGFLGALGHMTLIRGFTFAPASLLSPFLYGQVIAAGLISVWLFGDILRWTTALGTAILIASGVYIWWRENRPRA